MFHTRYAARTLRDLNSPAISGWSIPSIKRACERTSPISSELSHTKNFQKKIGHTASHVWWHLKLYCIVVYHKKTHIRDVSIMTYKTTYKYDMAMTQYFIPNPRGIGWSHPLRTSRFEVMICIQWVYSPFFTIIIHYCSPLLFTTIIHHDIYIYICIQTPLYIHHYIYTIMYIYISQSFSTALALQGYPRSPNAQPFRTRELGAKTQRRTEPLRLTARELSQEIPRVNVKHHHVYHIIHI